MSKVVGKAAAFHENALVIMHYNFQLLKGAYLLDRDMATSINFENHCFENKQEVIDELETSIDELADEEAFYREKIRTAEAKGLINPIRLTLILTLTLTITLTLTLTLTLGLTKDQVDEAEKDLEEAVQSLQNHQQHHCRLKALKIDKPLLHYDAIVSTKSVASSMNIINKVICLSLCSCIVFILICCR